MEPLVVGLALGALMGWGVAVMGTAAIVRDAVERERQRCAVIAWKMQMNGSPAGGTDIGNEIERKPTPTTPTTPNP